MKNSFFLNNPYKLTYNESTKSIGFIPQTEEDKFENQKLIDKLNNIVNDKTSESYLNAKSFSDNLKAEIEKRFNSKK
jgi:hypothetical protein